MAILTISRQFGSKGREIGQAVARLLKYEYVDKQTILQDLKTAGDEWGKWGEELDEHSPTTWEKYDWAFRGFSALVQSCILDRVLSGNVVIMGRGANFLLKDIPSALRVCIIAPVEKRIETIMIRESVARETARWLAKQIDNDRAGFIRTIYGKEWDDPYEYDMIIDTGIHSEDEIIDNIKKALLEKDRHTSDIQTLRMRAKAAKVKAGLLTNRKLFIPTLDVSHENESIVLRGILHSPKEHKALEEEAKRLADDIPVKCELHYRK